MEGDETGDRTVESLIQLSLWEMIIAWTKAVAVGISKGGRLDKYLKSRNIVIQQLVMCE